MSNRRTGLALDDRRCLTVVYGDTAIHAARPLRIMGLSKGFASPGIRKPGTQGVPYLAGAEEVKTDGATLIAAVLMLASGCVTRPEWIQHAGDRRCQPHLARASNKPQLRRDGEA